MEVALYGISTIHNDKQKEDFQSFFLLIHLNALVENIAIFYQRICITFSYTQLEGASYL